MRANRLLDSSRHAARFVSLLPFEKDEALGGAKYVSCLSPLLSLTFLPGRIFGIVYIHFYVKAKVLGFFFIAFIILCLFCNLGGVEEHAILLCNLLLGFGLDAYVCVGTVGNTSHCVSLTTDVAF